MKAEWVGVKCQAALVVFCLWLLQVPLCLFLRKHSSPNVETAFNELWFWRRHLVDNTAFWKQSGEELLKTFDAMEAAPLPLPVDLPFVNITFEEAIADPSLLNPDACILIRNFVGGAMMEKYGSVENFLKASNNTEYEWSTGISTGVPSVKRRYPLHDAVRRMQQGEKLYGGFMFDFVPDNPDIQTDLDTLYEKTAGIPFFDMIGSSPRKTHLSFIYHDEWHFSSLHSAPIASALLQISGTKKWLITVPDMIPYLAPQGTTSQGMFYHQFSMEGSRIPHLEVYSNPGDFFYFPEYWPHEVSNVGSFGFATAYRPALPFQIFGQFLTPLLLNRHNVFFQNVGVFWKIFTSKFEKVDSAFSVNGRNRYLKGSMAAFYQVLCHYGTDKYQKYGTLIPAEEICSQCSNATCFDERTIESLRKQGSLSASL